MGVIVTSPLVVDSVSVTEAAGGVAFGVPAGVVSGTSLDVGAGALGTSVRSIVGNGGAFFSQAGAVQSAESSTKM
jgi:hypothetical protein